MTTQMTETNDAPETSNGQGNKPTMIAKQRVGYGKKASYERIGVAWTNDDGSLYVKVHGTQVISGGFVLYPVEGDSEKAGS
ncbi:MAG: hypothetical protein RIC93_01340 [Alphaproteobacteria bacterium]